MAPVAERVSSELARLLSGDEPYGRMCLMRRLLENAETLALRVLHGHETLTHEEGYLVKKHKDLMSKRSLEASARGRGRLVALESSSE